MRKLFLSMFTIISLAGISLAGNCYDHQQMTMADNKPVLLLQNGDMKLMKYTNGGMVLYSLKNIAVKPLRKIWTANSWLHVFQKWLKIWKVKTLGDLMVSQLTPLSSPYPLCNYFQPFSWHWSLSFVSTYLPSGFSEGLIKNMIIGVIPITYIRNMLTVMPNRTSRES